MAFWRLIKPATHKIVRVTRATRARQSNEEVTLPSTYTVSVKNHSQEAYVYLYCILLYYFFTVLYCTLLTKAAL